MMQSFHEWLKIREANARLVMPGQGVFDPRSATGDVGSPVTALTAANRAGQVHPEVKIANFKRMLQQLGPQHPTVQQFLNAQQVSDPATYEQLRAMMG